MRRITLFLILFAIVPACSGRKAPSAVDSFEAKAQIDSLWTGYARAADRQDSTAFGELFAEDAVLLYAARPTVRGRAAIGPFLAGLYAAIDAIGLRVAPYETRTWGDVAIQSGSLEEIYVEKGAQRTEYGRYALIAERGRDGVWRIGRMVSFADSIR